MRLMDDRKAQNAIIVLVILAIVLGFVFLRLNDAWGHTLPQSQSVVQERRSSSSLKVKEKTIGEFSDKPSSHSCCYQDSIVSPLPSYCCHPVPHGIKKLS
jgi:hypothetical protein